MAAQRKNSKNALLLKAAALAAVAALVQGCAQTPAGTTAGLPAAPSEASVAAHVATATRAAGTDLQLDGFDVRSRRRVGAAELFIFSKRPGAHD